MVISFDSAPAAMGLEGKNMHILQKQPNVTRNNYNMLEFTIRIPYNASSYESPCS